MYPLYVYNLRRIISVLKQNKFRDINGHMTRTATSEGKRSDVINLPPRSWPMSSTVGLMSFPDTNMLDIQRNNNQKPDGHPW